MNPMWTHISYQSTVTTTPMGYQGWYTLLNHLMRSQVSSAQQAGRSDKLEHNVNDTDRNQGKSSVEMAKSSRVYIRAHRTPLYEYTRYMNNHNSIPDTHAWIELVTCHTTITGERAYSR